MTDGKCVSFNAPPMILVNARHTIRVRTWSTVVAKMRLVIRIWVPKVPTEMNFQYNFSTDGLGTEQLIDGAIDFQQIWQQNSLGQNDYGYLMCATLDSIDTALTGTQCFGRVDIVDGQPPSSGWPVAIIIKEYIKRGA